MENLETNNQNRVWKNTVTPVIAFLIGVKQKLYSVQTNCSLGKFQELYNNTDALLIRTLCTLRSNLMYNYAYVKKEIMYDIKRLNDLYIFQEDISTLKELGIDILQPNHSVNQYIIDLNKLIATNVERVKVLFPEWVEWKYIKKLFVMPRGTIEKSVIKELNKYQNELNYYPYRMYINWTPDNLGNILRSDNCFLYLLYKQNNDSFTDVSKVLDISEEKKNSIYDFIENNENVVIAVDCENVDPFKLAAMFTQLNSYQISKIQKISLYDDSNTTNIWQHFEEITNIPVDYVLVERLVANKSLVDIRLCSDITAQFYRDNINGFILVSSDSDFWGLISSLPDANFFVMYEETKAGQSIRTVLQNNNIGCCILDEFCSVNISNFKNNLLIRETNKELKTVLNTLNINTLVEKVYSNLYIEASSTEKSNFYKSVIDNLKIRVNEEGILKIIVKEF